MALKSNKIRIGLVGPSWPFRGGIAKFTTELAIRLEAKGHLGSFISPHRQYPRFLYPGKTDRDDSACKKLSLNRSMYSYFEPWTWGKVITEIEKSNIDCVVVPHWSLASAPFLKYLISNSSKPVIPIVHNLGDHDSLIRIPKLSEWVLEEGSAFLHHNPEYSKLPFFKERSTSVMCKLHPVTPVKKCSSFISKKKFGIPDGLTSFLFFGLIRPYKGLDTLLDAIEQLPDNTPVAFLIGGEPWRDKKRIEKRLNKISKKFWIHSKLEWIAEQESSQWFSAADAVVCPYVRATGSGVLSQALAFEKPVLTTDTGSLAHVVTHGKNGLLSQPKSSIELCRNIQLFLEPSVRRTLQSGSRNQKKHSWDDYVSGVIHLAKNSANRVSRETPWIQ